MDALMTLEEVAAFLRVSKDTVYSMANNGKIPATRVGAQWRFRKEDVDKWLEENRNVAQVKKKKKARKRRKQRKSKKGK